MYRSKSLIAQVEARTPGKPPSTLTLRRLRRFADLHIAAHGAVLSTATYLPNLLKEQFHCVPTQDENAEADTSNKQLSVKSMQPMRIFLLWPALQEPPAWLSEGFKLMRGTEVKVRWSFTPLQLMWLNITNNRRMYEDQALTVWQAQKPMAAGDEALLPAPFNATAQAHFGAPAFGYVACLRVASSIMALSSCAATLATKLMQTKDMNPATCSLQQIYIGLEDGTFDPTEFSMPAASTLVARVIMAEDDELLIMLVEAGIVQSCPRTSLQQLLQYSMLAKLPFLAQLLLQETQAELNETVLHWLLHDMLSMGNIEDVADLLSSYITARRNPLSATAAVKWALESVSTKVVLYEQEVLQLAARFGDASLKMLEQLVQQYSPHQQLCEPSSGTDAPGKPHPSMFIRSSADAEADQQQQSLQPSLNTVLQQCLEEKSLHQFGRDSSHSFASIHDVSPYELAIRMVDADFLAMPAIQAYTNHMWRGTEQQKMRSLFIGAATGLGSRAYKRGILGNSIAGKKSKQVMASPDTFADSALQAQNTDVPADMASSSCITALGPCRADMAISSGSSSMDGSCCLVLSSSADTLASSRQLAATTAAEYLPVPSLLLADATGTAARSQGPGPVGEGVHFDSMDHVGLVSPSCSSGAVQTSTSTTAAFNNDSKPVRSAASSLVSGSSSSVESSASKAFTIDSWLSPAVWLELLRNMGLASPGFQPFAWLASLLLHTVLVAPRAFHNSPRGKFIKRCMFELLFLVMYQATVTGTGNITYFWYMPLLVIGNIVELIHQFYYKFHSSLSKMLASHWAVLDALFNMGLLASLLMHLAELLQHNQHALGEPLLENAHSEIGFHTVMESGFAVLVWCRALGLMTPLSAGLGALLCTVRMAAKEASVLVPAVVVMVLGFGTSLTVVYSKVQSSEYGSLGGAVQALVSEAAGDVELKVFEDHAAGNPTVSVWGQVIVTLYVVIVNILLMTLLIAIVSHTYHPESVRRQAVVMQAEQAHRYAMQIQHCFACSPANVFQLVLSWLPHGFRTRKECFQSWCWLFSGVDGYFPPGTAAAADLLIPTGPAEIAYLAFLVSLYPLMAAMALLCLLLHIPWGVWYFATTGHVMWLESGWDRGAPKDGLAAGVDHTPTNIVANDTARPQPLRRRASIDTHVLKRHMTMAANGDGSLFDALETVGATSAGKSTSMLWRSAVATARQGPSALLARQPRDWNSDGGASGYKTGSFAFWFWGLPLVVCLSGGCRVARQWLAPLIAVLVAAAVGFLLLFALLLLSVLVLCWTYVVRLLFSLFCIFIPAAANHNVCLHPTRHAQFFSKDSVQAVFDELNSKHASAQQPSMSAAHLPRKGFSMSNHRLSRSTKDFMLGYSRMQAVSPGLGSEGALQQLNMSTASASRTPASRLSLYSSCTTEEFVPAQSGSRGVQSCASGSTGVGGWFSSTLLQSTSMATSGNAVAAGVGCSASQAGGLAAELTGLSPAGIQPQLAPSHHPAQVLLRLQQMLEQQSKELQEQQQLLGSLQAAVSGGLHEALPSSSNTPVSNGICSAAVQLDNNNGQLHVSTSGMTIPAASGVCSGGVFGSFQDHPVSLPGSADADELVHSNSSNGCASRDGVGPADAGLIDSSVLTSSGKQTGSATRATAILPG